MGNSMVHLVTFFSWAKKVMSKNIDVGILRKIKYFTDSILSGGVLNLAITTINYVECLHETWREN